MKKILLLITMISATLAFTTTSILAASKLVVGTNPVPGGEILNFIKGKMEDRGVELEIKEFSDYVTPNLALEDGSLDANFFQHVPYLKVFSEQHNINDLVQLGKGVLVAPILGTSYAYKSIQELKEGDAVAIPNDPTNEGRALLLLHNNGIIKLKDATNLKSTVQDIADNPKKLKFKELEAPQIPRVIINKDVQFGIINVNYALQGGLDLSKTIIKEGSESPYINVVVVKSSKKDNKDLQILDEVIHLPEVRDFINKKYNGTVVPTF